VNDVVLYAVLSLAAIGTVAAIILYFIATKFKVIEDPRIDEVEEALPSANCGGCGFAGCRAFAEATVKQGNDKHNLEGLSCPVGGNDVMAQVATILGLEVEEQDPLIAVIRCNGGNINSPKKVSFEGATSCAFAHSLFTGEGGCPYGCLGLGDCVAACEFDAIHMSPERGLPEVNNKCVACGACVEACPRDIIELRPKGRKEKRIFVSCINKEKGAVARKNCTVACIGCSACFKVCEFDAITMKDNLAYIDPFKCKLCRKCVVVCPTNAIHEINFPPRKKKEGDSEKAGKTLAVKHPEKEKEVVVGKVNLTENVKPEGKKIEAEKPKQDSGQKDNKTDE
jgi:Na+-translocating ferredoxin:NAD+ oxidoreductase RNF subunit RnfB